MICHHCPDRTFGDEAEYEAHCAAHESVQKSLRRRYGRTYGGRTEYAPMPTISLSTVRPVLPVTRVDNNHAAPAPGQARESNVGGGPSPFQLTGNASGDDELHDLVSRFMIQDKTYLFFRGFSTLNIQNLLWMQTELIGLEQQLKDAAKEDVGQEQPDSANGRDSPTIRLKDLISGKLQAYNTALLQVSQLSDLERPDPASVSDMHRWAGNIGKADHSALIFLAEGGETESDLVALSRSLITKTGMYRLVENLSWRFFTTPITGGKRILLPKGGSLYLYDDKMIRKTLRAILTLITSMVLLIPVVLLSYIEDKRQTVVTVAVCTAVMAAILSVATDCREYEIITAASAYAAVLVVFVGNTATANHH